MIFILKSFENIFQITDNILIYFYLLIYRVTQKEIAWVGRRVFYIRNILETLGYRFTCHLSTASGRDGPQH